MSAVRRTGYTLVELLVALAIMGLLSVMLVAGLSRRGEAWTRMDRATTRGEAIEAAQGVLRARLQHAWPATRYDIRPAGPDFEGDADRLVFLAPPPDRDGPGTLRRHVLLLDADGDLVLEMTNDLSLTPARPERREVLLRGVRAVDFAYFGPLEPDPTPRWQARWRQRAAMPSLVRVRLELAGGRERWPDLLVRPLADIDADCVLMATGGCRGR